MQFCQSVAFVTPHMQSYSKWTHCGSLYIPMDKPCRAVCWKRLNERTCHAAWEIQRLKSYFCLRSLHVKNRGGHASCVSDFETPPSCRYFTPVQVTSSYCWDPLEPHPLSAWVDQNVSVSKVRYLHLTGSEKVRFDSYQYSFFLIVLQASSFIKCSSWYEIVIRTKNVA